ncbi:DUF892 family protein [Polaribacter sp.]|uniref:DUF892 family protein n=1 Tax=Polaribacter sp. TaxID=1920175 RepID=UPI003F6B58F3
MNTLRDLFKHEIHDLYSAEKQLTNAFPNMINATTDDTLKIFLKKYSEKISDHYEMIQSICDELNSNPRNTKCQAMEGLINECEGMLSHDANKEVMDAAIIARVQRIMHYEISGYGTAVRFAKEIGENAAAEKLQEILNYKYVVDKSLGQMAEKRINEEALA